MLICVKVDEITKAINRAGWRALAIHGDKNQQDRDYVLNQFRMSTGGILVATDVAARGLGEYSHATGSLHDRVRLLGCPQLSTNCTWKRLGLMSEQENKCSLALLRQTLALFAFRNNAKTRKKYSL